MEKIIKILIQKIHIFTKKIDIFIEKIIPKIIQKIVVSRFSVGNYFGQHSRNKLFRFRKSTSSIAGVRALLLYLMNFYCVCVCVYVKVCVCIYIHECAWAQQRESACARERENSGKI